MIYEHKLLYKTKGPVPAGYYTVPLDKAEVRRPGRDLTIVASGIMCGKALDAAAELAKEGIEAEVIDPRSLRPLDLKTLIESVKRTSRLLCVYEGVKTPRHRRRNQRRNCRERGVRLSRRSDPPARRRGIRQFLTVRSSRRRRFRRRRTLSQPPASLRWDASDMAVEVILPRVDMDMTTGKIAKWFVEEGRTVAKGQALFEIESDKAAMEIEAPAAGVLSGVTGRPGDELPVGTVVGWIVAPGETFAEPKRAATAGVPVTPRRGADARRPSGE